MKHVSLKQDSTFKSKNVNDRRPIITNAWELFNIAQLTDILVPDGVEVNSRFVQ